MKDIDIYSIPLTIPTDKLKKDKYASATRNACKVCSPLGASVVYKGIRGCIPLIHGSQGCATYIRRYMISHFREPVDIASSSFTESSTVFGGASNFNQAVINITRQYHPEVIGICTTCLSETIGEDLNALVSGLFKQQSDVNIPSLVWASTPSYEGTHLLGYYKTLAAVVETFAKNEMPGNHVNILSSFQSPEDIRHLKEIVADFGVKGILLPDYSDTLDSTIWNEYRKISPGGTGIDDISLMGSAQATIEMEYAIAAQDDHYVSGGQYLKNQYNVPLFRTGIPVGIIETDKFFNALSKISNKPIPEKYNAERGRLVDSYVDGHKYVFGKRAVVYGDEDFVISTSAFLNEIGIKVVLCVTGAEKKGLQNEMDGLIGEGNVIIHEDTDFEVMRGMASELKPDILIGNSKGYYIAREMKIPVVRAGFPVHDRFGGQRLLSVGYRGTQQFFDRIVNALLEYKQENSPVGFKYM
jgi:nitrogenase molybdenum-iron protein NifN